MGEKTADEKLEELTEKHAALAATVENMHDQMARRGWFVEDVAGVDPPSDEPAAEETAPTA